MENLHSHDSRAASGEGAKKRTPWLWVVGGGRWENLLRSALWRFDRMGDVLASNCFALLLTLPLFGQVAEKIDIDLDGKPFTTFHSGADVGRPYLAPLRSPSGKIITRRFPMENVAGESRDHLHHRGLWFSYDDVNGVKFWENDPSYTDHAVGRIVIPPQTPWPWFSTGTITAAKQYWWSTGR
jgi:hypothetical protein